MSFPFPQISSSLLHTLRFHDIKGCASPLYKMHSNTYSPPSVSADSKLQVDFTVSHMWLVESEDAEPEDTEA